MISKEILAAKYPTAVYAAFGDSSELADELAELIASGVKTGSCGSLAGCIEENAFPVIGAYGIVENGSGVPVCVIRTTRLHLLRFSEMTDELARKEGEGDLSLDYWKKEHQRFFEGEGTFTEDMEVIFEEFSLIERIQ
ncbi:ASCH domain-containing protein [Yersinia canariae]|uniref:ASCH domain-containing protein n=1 Tax=Yersinia canariae TaxID=2607663 RepID=UPI0011AAFE2A|nr:ASCH domain-containing protein [Yersinia canariae]